MAHGRGQERLYGRGDRLLTCVQKHACIPQTLLVCCCRAIGAAQGFKEPCKDIFVEADDVVSSIVAAPLLISRHMHSKGCLSQCQQGIADVVHSPTGHKKASGSSPRHHKHPRMHTDPAHPEQTHEPAQQPPQQQQPVPPHSQWYGCLFVAHQSPYAFETELHAITAVSKMLGGTLGTWKGHHSG